MNTHRPERHRRRQPLGQHFLREQALAERIAAAADISPADTVLEIGPGRGALTRALARRSRAVVAVENDGDLADALISALRGEGASNVRIVHGDIRDLEPDDLDLPPGYRVVANIPYYLTGRLIRQLLTAGQKPADITIMVQKEVAERMAARPPRMNLLAIAVQAYARPEILFRVSRQAFVPRPRVDSALIRLGNIGNEFFSRQHLPEELFFTVVRAAFRGQRKILENALTHGLGVTKPHVAAAVGTLGLSGKRPAELSLDQWARLARKLKVSK